MLFEQLADAQADEVEIVRAEISETEDSQLDSVAEQDMAPGMEIQAEEISEAFLEIPELKYENWEHLSPEERIDALQRMETLTAEIEHRPMAPIVGEQMGSSTYGYFSPEDGMIHINLDYLTNNSYESYCETLDTLFHEGRHAYQTFNAFSGTVVHMLKYGEPIWTLICGDTEPRRYMDSKIIICSP